MKRKRLLIAAFLPVVMLFLLSGCSISDTKSEYEQSKAECKQYIIDSQELIGSIVRRLDVFDFGMDIYCSEGSIEVYGKMSGSERSSVMGDDELIEELTALFENEYIDAVSKAKGKNETSFSYIIHFTTIRRGYSCCAYRADDPTEIGSEDERLFDNWYYFEGRNE